MIVEVRRAFVTRCKRQRESLLRQQELFSNGTLTMYDNQKNVTPTTLATIVKNIAQLDGLIAKSEAAGW